MQLDSTHVVIARIGFNRRQQARDAGRVFRARAQRLFLPAAQHPRGYAHARAHHQRANALGAVNLMPGQGVAVNAQRAHINRQTHKALHAVHMQHGLRAQPVAQLRNLAQGHHRARFIVYLHYADKPRIGGQQFFQRVQAHHARRVIGNLLHIKGALQAFAGRGHGRVLASGIKHAPAALHGHAAKDGQVVGLGAAGGKHHPGGIGVQLARNGLAASG